MPLPSAMQLRISMWLDGKLKPFEIPLDCQFREARPTTRRYCTATLVGSTPLPTAPAPSRIGNSPE